MPAIPQPPPLFEIYVYAPEVEGIHLRGGKIARGGLRWSDRMDYRTEVFGLMRAQMTKNAVIVPDGAKGGFYLRQRPDEPAALKAEVERGYVTFISGLLDLTDNLVEGEVVHPEGVRVLDDDDTYLVVAADKGTATFSDTANRVAGRYGFWLGDAFASGGSKGYDHKALGITARGAWESLKRHFRELDLDPAVDEFTAVGIGDMSGDVFGNGMLLSDKIRLVAAYDHRHVFIDPDPDAAKGFAERKRLDSISPGVLVGRLRPRRALRGRRRVAAQRQAHRAARAGARGAGRRRRRAHAERGHPRDPPGAGRRAVERRHRHGRQGLDGDRRRGAATARATPSASTRPSCAAASWPRAATSGCTQRARIEFAREGGLINADFIDNSAGVDCSDHEVNLKVLLDLAVRRGELEAAERDALLAEVTDDVAAHVLYDSFLQAQMLAQEVRGSATRMFAYEDLMAALEAEGLLAARGRVPAHLRGDGRSPALGPRPRAPGAGRAARLRQAQPHAARCCAPRCPTTPTSKATCAATSRRAVVERLGHLLGEHPLRRELVATIVSNHVVNALGPTFVSRLVAEQGAEPADVVRAYRIARDVTGAERRWAEVERLDGRRPPGAVEAAGGHRRARRVHGALVPARTPPGSTWARRSPPGARASGACWRCCPSSTSGARRCRARRPRSSSRASPTRWPTPTPT